MVTVAAEHDRAVTDPGQTCAEPETAVDVVRPDEVGALARERHRHEHGGVLPPPHFFTVVGKVGLVRSITAQQASSIASVATNHWRAPRVRSGETATRWPGSRDVAPVEMFPASEPLAASPLR